MLKNLLDFVLEFIVEIFNACFKLNYFPPGWKKAVIMVIFKGKDPIQPSSYRPISHLNTKSKALEAMFMSRLQTFIDENNLICDD